jgi:hypothetical protein
LLHLIALSDTRTHTRKDSSGRGMGLFRRPLPNNTKHSQETDIYVPGGIWTHNSPNRVAADPRFRPQGHWDKRTRNPMAVFTRACYWSLSWPRRFHPPLPAILNIHFNIIQPFTPRCHRQNTLLEHLNLSICRAIDLLLFVLSTVKHHFCALTWNFGTEFHHRWPIIFFLILMSAHGTSSVVSRQYFAVYGDYSGDDSKTTVLNKMLITIPSQVRHVTNAAGRFVPNVRHK